MVKKRKQVIEKKFAGKYRRPLKNSIKLLMIELGEIFQKNHDFEKIIFYSERLF